MIKVSVDKNLLPLDIELLTGIYKNERFPNRQKPTQNQLRCAIHPWALLSQ